VRVCGLLGTHTRGSGRDKARVEDNAKLQLFVAEITRQRNKT